MTANPGYWGEGPYLDKVRFVPIEAGARLDSLDGGEVDASILEDPLDITAARKAGYAGYMTIFAMGGIVAINHTDPHPGADLEVRQAIAHAIDPDVIDERAYEGGSMPGKKMYQEYSPWSTDAEATPSDPEEARAALERAKENGFDGKLKMLYLAGRDDEALTAEAMLEAVGFEVTPTKSATVNEYIQAYFVDRTWDITMSGLGAEPSISPYIGLSTFLVDEGNYIDYHNPQMDQLVDDLRRAPTPEETLRVLGEIQQLWTDDVPAVPIYAEPKMVLWTGGVHGVRPTLQASVLLQEAWVE